MQSVSTIAVWQLTANQWGQVLVWPVIGWYSQLLHLIAEDCVDWCGQLLIFEDAYWLVMTVIAGCGQMFIGEGS